MELATLRRTGDSWSRPFPPLDSDRTLVLAFAAPTFADDPGPLDELRAAYPTSTVIGCSSSGEIDQAQVLDGSIVVAVVRFEHTRVRTARARLSSAAESAEAGGAIAEALAADDLRAVIVLSEGVGVNGSELVRGLNARLPAGVVITGGLAGDADRFVRTWVLSGAGVTTHAVVAVGMYGDALRVTHGSQGGWDAFGPERLVTGSDGNVLHSLDGRPALALYKDYLGERARELPGAALLFPLALRSSLSTPHSVVRTVLSVDEEAQSMTFAGDIPVGHYVKLMRANFDRLILGARGAGQAALGDHQGPALSIAVSCVGRRLVLGQRSEEETEATLETLPAGTAQIGFYSYGEISPHTDGRCDLHNQTMTLTVLSEAT